MRAAAWSMSGRWRARWPLRDDGVVLVGRVAHVRAVWAAPPGHIRPKEFTIYGQPGLEFLGEAIIGMDGLYRTYRFAESAVDALVRLDIQGAPALVDAIDRTCREAR